MKEVSLKTTIIVGILVFILSFGTTFALNVWSSDNTLISGTTKCFKVNYTKGQDINFGSVTSGTGLVAQTIFNKDEAVSTTLTISRNKDCDICGTGTISANIASSIDLSTGGLSYKVYKGSEELKTGSITKTGVNTLYDNFDIKNITSTTYTIYFYLDSNKINNDYLQTNFTGKIYAEAKSTNKICNISNSNDLYTRMLSNATLDTDIDFAKISSDTNGKGIYMRSGTEDEANPIFYYRGAVDNNNLLFANFCWKIVRTTETGGIKLIYNGLPSNGTCNNTGDSTQIGTSAFNTPNNSPAYVGYMYGTVYPIKKFDMSMPSDEFNFGKDVTYSNGVYTLNSTTTVSAVDYVGESEKYSNNYHYTCFSSSDTCSNVYYIYYVGSDLAYYITLTGGKKVEDALAEMLDNNTNNSKIKEYIDNWYSTNMTSYTTKLEDTVWCNDRSIYSKGGWDPEGGDTTSYLYFFAHKRAWMKLRNPSLTCSRNIDKFTTNTSNGNGNLTYPVGLLTADEIMLAGGAGEDSNSSYYLYTGNAYWVGSPYDFIIETMNEFYVKSDGKLIGYDAKTVYGVRPSVSLAPGTEISSGNGTANSPYIVN